MKNNNSIFYTVKAVMLIVMLGTFFLSCAENAQRNENADPVIEDSVVDQAEFLPVKENENKDRDVWQKPNIVIDLLGDLSNKTVVDIGAGTGYFTFRFALKANKVIAIEIEKNYLEIINTFKRNLPGELQDRIETRLATPSDPLLKAEEADMIIIINTIGEIKPRKAYLKTLLPGLKKGGQLVIVDYKMKNLPLENVPPQKDRVPLNIIEKELDDVGYTDIISNDTSLDYQYIVFASKPME